MNHCLLVLTILDDDPLPCTEAVTIGWMTSLAAVRCLTMSDSSAYPHMFSSLLSITWQVHVFPDPATPSGITVWDWLVRWLFDRMVPSIVSRHFSLIESGLDMVGHMLSKTGPIQI